MLPPEIVYEVLSCYLPGLNLSVRNPQTFPWYLGHICRRWRSIFVSSPQFWDHFSFGVRSVEPGISIPHLERALELIKLCIRRTEGHLFSFKFNVSYASRLDCISMTALWLYCSQIMETLLAHSNQWLDVHIMIDGSKMNELLKAKRHWDFPHLRTLQICHPIAFYNSSHIFLDLFAAAPNLERAYIDQYYKLNWSNLSVLHIELQPYETYQGLIKALSETSCLERLVISGNAVSTGLTLNPVKLPFLKVLSFDRDDHATLINAPALEELYITSQILMPLFAVTAFLGHVNHLKCLSLALLDSSVTQILQLTPEVERLSLYGDISFYALKHLASYMVSQSLKEISVVIRCRYQGRPNPAGLADIITTWDKQRFKRLRLLRVYIYPPGTDSSTAVDRLKQWCEEHGVELVVEFSDLYVEVPFENP